MKIVWLIPSLMWLSACATTGAPSAVSDVAIKSVVTESRPVLKTKQAALDVEGALTLGQKAYKSERYKQALSNYQSILLQQPSHIEARIGAADSLLALGRAKEAHRLFEGLKEEADLEEPHKKRIEVGVRLSAVVTELSETPEEELNAALEFADDDPRIWNALGLYRDSYGDWMKAQDSFVMALNTGQATSSIINNMGLSLLKQGRYQEAVDKFTQAMRINATKPLYDNNRRLTLILMERYSEAFKNMDDKRTAALYNDAGYLAMTRGDKKKARALLTKALDISPSYHVKAAANLAELESKTES